MGFFFAFRDARYKNLMKYTLNNGIDLWIHSNVERIDENSLTFVYVLLKSTPPIVFGNHTMAIGHTVKWFMVYNSV